MLEQQIGILTKGPSINDVFSKGEGGRGDPHLESMGGGGGLRASEATSSLGVIKPKDIKNERREGGYTIRKTG